MRIAARAVSDFNKLEYEKNLCIKISLKTKHSLNHLWSLCSHEKTQFTFIANNCSNDIFGDIRLGHLNPTFWY